MSYILIVEDEPTVRQLLARVLSRTPHVVQLAETAAEAAGVLRARGCPKLMIVDMVLPDANGRDLLKTMSVACPDAKAVLMSGYPLGDQQRLGFNSEVTYLEKPFDNAVLLSVVHAAMG